jgi:hypothetical protein
MDPLDMSFWPEIVVPVWANNAMSLDCVYLPVCSASASGSGKSVSPSFNILS